MSIATEIEKMLSQAGSSSKHRATVLRTDNDGTVWVSIPGGADETFLHGTYVGFEPGDEIEITIKDGRAIATGNATSPSVGQRSVNRAIAPVIEQVDSLANSLRVAGDIAEEAANVASATNQHFWSRSTDQEQDGAGTGAFVTDDEQDDFLEAAADGFPDLSTRPWHNLLMNSLGILLRTGLNNLVSITKSAIAFYDGNGNQAQNIVASFGSSGAQIGRENSYRTSFDEYGIEVAGGTSLFEVSSAVKQPVENQQFVSDRIHYAYKGNFENPADPMHDFGCCDEYAIFELPSGVKIYDEMRFVWYDAEQEIIGFYGNQIYVRESTYLWFTDETPVGPDCNWMPWYGFPDAVTGIMIASDSHDYFYRNAFPLNDPTLVFNGIQHSWDYANVSKPHMRFGTGTLSSSDDQAVFGRWNIEDSIGSYAVVIGNGTKNSVRSNGLTVDWNGNVECGSVNGSGTVVPAATASIDVPNSSLTNVCSVSLPPGVWLVTGLITFEQNGTGRRVIKLSTTSQDSANVPSQTMQPAISNVGTRMSTTRCFTLASQTTVYLIGNQNSGARLACSGSMEATKIG